MFTCCLFCCNFDHALTKTPDVKTAIVTVLLFAPCAYWCWNCSDMELDGIDVSVCAAALHAIKHPSVEGRYRRIMVYFLVSFFCDWICKPGTERRRRGQSTGLRQCHINQGSVRLQRSTQECNSDKRIRLNRRGSAEERGHKTSVQGRTICLETYEGSKISQGLGYNISAGTACHYGCEFRLKHRASNGGLNRNTGGTQAARTGLNLHFILIILFSTNKLTPEKT